MAIWPLGVIRRTVCWSHSWIAMAPSSGRTAREQMGWMLKVELAGRRVMLAARLSVNKS